MRRGLGVNILSTPAGILTDREARKPQRRRRAPLLGVVGITCHALANCRSPFRPV